MHKMANNNNDNGYGTATFAIDHSVHKSIYGDDWRTVPDNKVKKNNNNFFFNLSSKTNQGNNQDNQRRDKNGHIIEVKSFKQLEQQRDYFLYKDENKSQ